MKKILLIIMMLLTIVLTSACSKKDPTPRTMDNFVNDFTMSSTGFDDYEKISKTEKGLNKLTYIVAAIFLLCTFLLGFGIVH